jgi:DNA-binding transcriptional ArsR family regulator
MQSSRLQLHDKKDDDHDQPIQHLLDALARFGHGLAALPDLDTPDGGQPSEPSMREIGDLPADAGVIRDMIRARRLRDELFGPGLFADPAWDILLDLTAARIEGRSVAVSSLCIAAAVPATTALRWIKQLTEAGLLRRVADPDDGRRIFIELSDDAARMMANYFASAARPPKS